jgi:hypothetical protein
MNTQYLSKNRFMLFAFAIAFGAHLLLALFVQPDLQLVPRMHPNPVRISHIPAPEKLDQMRAVWSPMLFSLPNENGFSRAFLESRNFSTESTQSNGAKVAPYLESPFALPPSRAVAIHSTPTAALQIRPVKPASVFRPAPPKGGVHLRAENGLAERLLDPPDLTPFANQSGWQYAAMLTVSSDGYVRHVFIEPQKGDPAPAKLISQLYQLRFRAAAEETQGRISVYSLNGDNGK